MATVTFKGATRIYPGSTKPALDKLDLEVQDGEFLVLVGPSGCGKSTSLRMLAGLEEVNEGAIFIGDRDVTNLAPKDRDIAMVFQSYALYPHMTVRENMGFALQIAGMDKKEIESRVQEAGKPKAMSGGQRQRVAMGRAIVRNPQVFLMDEPLSNLDAKLRVQTRTQIAKLQRDLGVTTVYVTHDQTEAMTMGDRIAVLKDGLLMQVGTPQDLYDTPNNVFVAGFIGSPAMNIIEAPLIDGKVRLGNKAVDIPEAPAAELARRGRKSVILGMRPEDLRVTDSETAWPVEVLIVEGLGADAYVYTEVQLPGGTTQQVVVRTDGRQIPARGTMLGIEAIPHHVHLFDPTTGDRLPGE
jgi:multiple sugar transport system ATP-binding protein